MAIKELPKKQYNYEIIFYIGGYKTYHSEIFKSEFYYDKNKCIEDAYKCIKYPYSKDHYMVKERYIYTYENNKCINSELLKEKKVNIWLVD